MQAAEDSRQLVGGQRMEADAIGKPSPALGDPLDQLDPGARQRHAAAPLDAAHGGKEQFLHEQGAPRSGHAQRRAHNPAGFTRAPRSARAVTGSSAGSQAYS